MFLEIHMLKRFPDACRKRGEGGVRRFGGVRRGRISAKRLISAWRESPLIAAAGEGLYLRNLPEKVVRALEARGADAETIETAWKKLVALSTGPAREAADGRMFLQADADEIAGRLMDVVRRPDGRRALERRKPRTLWEDMADLFERLAAPQDVLFDGDAPVMCVSDALSVDALTDGGGDNLYLLYAWLDVERLSECLCGEPGASERIGEWISGIVRTMATVYPAARGVAASVLPDAILLEWRKEGLPLSHIGAFAQPLQEADAHEGIVRLIRAVDCAQMPAERRAWMAPRVDIRPADCESFDFFAELVAHASAWSRTVACVPMVAFRLEGASMRWREGGDAPARSEILRLLADALDLERDGAGHAELARRLSVAVRTDRAGVHPARKRTLLDAAFTVFLQGDRETLSRCAQALLSPARPLFLGKPSHVISAPLQPEYTEAYISLHDAIQHHPAAARHDRVMASWSE